ncbi:MAG TPA: LamG-like jellyroll fold domain-containing protein [Chitinophagaceae bacterium]|nr:LamG-like jellyroll fold domain-containing protein [Chitinophagaceae bacterium]
MKGIYKNGLLALALAAFSSLLLTSCYKKFDPSSYAPKLSIGGYTSSKEIAPSNLVGYWAFDGSLVDSVSNQAGTNAGTGFTAGVKGQALQGADQSYVVFDPSQALQNLQSFTITCWVNSPQNTNGIVGLFDLANTNAFWGNLDLFFENGSTASKAILKLHVNNNGTDAWVGNYEISNIWNLWTSLAITYDAASSTFKVFVNGSKIATQTQAGYGPLVFQNATKAVFGTVQFQTNPSLTSATDSQPWASYLTGALDEFRIYNTALSESDVNALVKLEGRGK